ncbi:MAG: N-acetylmuramoyl-L-alanine amidase [Bacteroidetes bacterium]|nr:N-acetylmuramoyl-L-alanine amidase [Bacteroidota bacterium]
MPLLALVCLTLLAFKGKPDDPKKGVKTIVIDAGHGGKDPGCNGVSCKEKDVALAIALKLGKLIEDNCKDVKVIYTRKTDVFVELEDRAEIANKNKADLFISIHCNAAGKPVMIKDKKTGKMRAKTFKNSRGKIVVVETTNPEPFGSETYVMDGKNEAGKMKVAQRENSVILLEDNYQSKYQGFDPDSDESYIIMSNYTSAYVIQSASLALKIQDEYARKAGRIDKGVHRQSIWVLWRTAMPSVLTEVGYLTNPIEEKFLGSEKGQSYMASAIFRAVRKYKDDIEGSKKNYNDEFENQEPLKNENTPEAQDSIKKLIGKKDDTEVADDTDAVKTNTTAATDEAAAEKAKAREKYDKLVASGDEQYKQKHYEEADKLYTEALTYAKGMDGGGYTKNMTDNATALKKQKEDIARKKAEEEAREKEAVKDKSDSTGKEPNSKDIAKTFKDKTKHDDQPADKTADKAGIVFKVQFAANDKEVDAKSKYPNVQDVSFYKMGTVFKYTSGNYTSIDDAVKQQTKLRELGYKDCFVVAFKEGKRIDINEARKLTSGQ